MHIYVQSTFQRIYSSEIIYLFIHIHVSDSINVLFVGFMVVLVSVDYVKSKNIHVENYVVILLFALYV